jgi:uncharacterized protein (DUF1800 family)
MKALTFKGRRAKPTHNLLSLVVIAAVLVGIFSPALVPVRAQRSPSKALTEEQRILHVLNRLGFGARPGDVQRIKALGLENYINQQLAPEKISDDVAVAKIKDLTTLNMTTAELYERFPQPGMLLRQLERRGELPPVLANARENRVKPGGENPPREMESGDAMSKDSTPNTPNPPANLNGRNNQQYREALRDYYRQNGLGQPQRILMELQASRILRAVYSERQLNEVMVDFWTNHFNVFAGKGADRWLLVSYDRDTIRPHAMGKFSDLLVATAQSPAMLFYLDNFQSVSPDFTPARRGARARGVQAGPPGREMDQQPLQQRMRRGINENYARELMELHTLGVDGGYTQKDVQEVARCFTGWTIFAPRGGGAAVSALLGEAARKDAGKFFFNARMHDDREKVVLGQKISSGGGFKDGLKVLEILARHPSTARYISTKLTRYFVSDNPPPAVVDRATAAFTKSNGDIRETLRAIFSSPEFYSQEAYRSKVKRPFELAISAIRTLGVDTNGGPQLHQWIARMGEPLYGYQTPNGYSDTADSWVNTGGLLERMNFGLMLASNRIPGTRVNLNRFSVDAGDTKADDSRIVNRIVNAVIGGDVSPVTKTTLLKQLKDQTPLTVQARPLQSSMGSEAAEMRVPRRRMQLAMGEANITDPVTKVVGLVLGSPEFQRQ